VQVEQLESAEAGRSQSGLDLLLVQDGLEFARRDQKVAGLVKHAVCVERIAENLEVLRLQHALVFLHLVEVRIDAPLSDFMRNDGDRVVLDEIGVVEVGGQVLGVEAARQAGTPLVASGAGR